MSDLMLLLTPALFPGMPAYGRKGSLLETSTVSGNYPCSRILGSNNIDYWDDEIARAKTADEACLPACLRPAFPVMEMRSRACDTALFRPTKTVQCSVVQSSYTRTTRSWVKKCPLLVAQLSM